MNLPYQSWYRPLTVSRGKKIELYYVTDHTTSVCCTVVCTNFFLLVSVQTMADEARAEKAAAIPITTPTPSGLANPGIRRWDRCV